MRGSHQRRGTLLPGYRQRAPCPAHQGVGHAGIELYAEAFEAAGRLDRLEAFASENGPRFYGLPLNDGTMELVRQPWTVPDEFPAAGDTLVPLRAGGTIAWRLAEAGQ